MCLVYIDLLHVHWPGTDPEELGWLWVRKFAKFLGMFMPEKCCATFKRQNLKRMTNCSLYLTSNCDTLKYATLSTPWIRSCTLTGSTFLMSGLLKLYTLKDKRHLQVNQLYPQHLRSENKKGQKVSSLYSLYYITGGIIFGWYHQVINKYHNWHNRSQSD